MQKRNSFKKTLFLLFYFNFSCKIYAQDDLFSRPLLFRTPPEFFNYQNMFRPLHYDGPSEKLSFFFNDSCLLNFHCPSLQTLSARHYLELKSSKKNNYVQQNGAQNHWAIRKKKIVLFLPRHDFLNIKQTNKLSKFNF